MTTEFDKLNRNSNRSFKTTPSTKRYYGLGSIETNGKYIKVCYGGNMGCSVEGSVNPMLKATGHPTVEELSKVAVRSAEYGYPSYSYCFVAKLK